MMCFDDQRREAYEYEQNAEADYIQELRREHHDPYALMSCDPDDKTEYEYNATTGYWEPTGE